MLQMKADGLDGFIADPDPLTIDGHDAVAAWNFCGGYYPERLPLFERLHGLSDAELTIHLMAVIRDV